MAADNGLIGGIRNVYLRRTALLAVSPIIVLSLAPAYLRALPAAVASAACEAWDEFAAHFREGNKLCAVAWTSVWAKDWKPYE